MKNKQKEWHPALKPLFYLINFILVQDLQDTEHIRAIHCGPPLRTRHHNRFSFYVKNTNLKRYANIQKVQTER
jgi:hypothetical protein